MNLDKRTKENGNLKLIIGQQSEMKLSKYEFLYSLNA
jgi:hypothetical protein